VDKLKQKKIDKEKKASSKASLVVSPKISKNPQNMDDLLRNYSWHGFKKGEVVEGIITEKNNKAVWVDIGAKTDGLILTKELKVARDFVKKLKVGDRLKVSIFQPENENSYPLLSFKKTLNNFI